MTLLYELASCVILTYFILCYVGRNCKYVLRKCNGFLVDNLSVSEGRDIPVITS